MSPPEQSPCKTCDQSPCKKPEKCEARWQYVQQTKSNGLCAVDIDGGYRLLPK